MDKYEDKLLSVIIPTYNRCATLDKGLERMKELSQKYIFDLIVCDNASTDNTQFVINKWSKVIPNMRVIKHEVNIFAERNFVSGYMAVKTRYCWVLGDSYTIDSKDFGKLLDYLNKVKPLAIIINDSVGNAGEKDVVYSDCNILFRELGWYTTLVCSCIINRDFISTERCKRYLDTNFLHEGIFYDYLAFQETINVHLLSSIHITNLPRFKSGMSWRVTPFLVFGKCWFSFVMSLPYIYTLDNKLHCIKEHNNHQHIFNPSDLLYKKMMGFLLFEDYRDARPVLRYVFDFPIIITDVINLLPPIPSCVLQSLRRIKKICKWPVQILLSKS